MAVDFDFDTSYDEDDEGTEPEEEYAEENYEDEEGSEPEEEGSRRSPLRLILLILLVLVLLCVVCYLASRFIPIPGFPPSEPEPTPPPAQETPAQPFDSSETQPEEGDEQAAEAGDESAQPTEEAVDQLPATEEAVGETPPTEEAVVEEFPATEETMMEPTTEPAEEATVVSGAEGDVEPTEEPTAEPTIDTTVVPGPTATPMPGQDQDAAAANCDTNTPPAADAGGPYEGMMGKGQAIVTFDGSGSSDSDGTIEGYEWDFGDGNSGTGETAVHSYQKEGSYTVILTVRDNCGAESQTSTDVTISGPTPPAPTTTPDNGDGDDDDNGDGGYVPPPVDPAMGTVGFCYIVQPGDTLYGIAQTHGVKLYDLAYVNGVSPKYYVIAGEGLFIPTGVINPQGPNIYQSRPGDTLNSIAAQCGVNVMDLAHVNGLPANTPLSPGQIVRIPPPWSY